MSRKTLSLPLVALLILLECVPLVSAHNAPFPPSYDPTQLVMDTVLEPETLDPAWANDIGSHEVIMNVYETLLFFDRNYRDGPYAAGKADQFVPRLATSWTEQVININSPEGLTWVRRWTFTIRTNVKFHDGSTLTPEDVEYSFERLLVQDRVGGPAWKDETRTERIVGFISRVTWNLMASWTSRRNRLLAGDTDLAYVDRQYRDQILGQEGFRSYYRWDGPEQPPPRIEPATSESGSLLANLDYSFPLLALDAFFFNFDISTTSPYLGPGFDSNNPYVIAEDRIPINLFSDINVRRGFAYAFYYELWLSSAYLGEGERPSDPVVKGVPYDNLGQEKYTWNDTVARYYLGLAWGDALWENGMSFDIVWPSGNTGRETAAIILANWVNGLNPKFHINYIEVSWGSTFMPQMVNRQLPLFVTGYQGNFGDPHAFVQPFMHSSGVFAHAQSYSNPTVDDLIETGIRTPDGPEREQKYHDLQTIYHDDVPSVPIVQPVGRQFERDWMRGWYYNPLYQGQYVYHRWKAKTHFGDATNDGAVGVADGGYISAHWTFSYGGGNYNPAADLTGGVGGLPGGGYGLVVGIPDGKVSVADATMVSAYWDGPPEGPSHP